MENWGDEKSVIEQLKFGGIDFSRVSISSISDDIPALKVIQMPFFIFRCTGDVGCIKWR